MNNVDTLRGDLAVSSSSIRRVALVAAAFSVAASIPMTASADTYTDGNGIEWTYTVLDETADPVKVAIGTPGASDATQRAIARDTSCRRHEHPLGVHE